MLKEIDPLEIANHIGYRLILIEESSQRSVELCFTHIKGNTIYGTGSRKGQKVYYQGQLPLIINSIKIYKKEY